MKKKRNFISLDEASEYLGLKPSTLYGYTHKKIIPYYRPGGRLYFTVEDLDNFIRSGRIEKKSKTEKKK